MVDAVKILGSILGNGNMASDSGSDILKSVLGAVVSGAESNDLGGMLSSALGGGQGNGANNPLGDLLGGMLSGNSGGGGGAADLLGGLLGGGSNASSAGGNPLGDILGGVLGGNDQSNGLGSILGAALSQFGNTQQAAMNNMQPRQFAEISPNLDYETVNNQALLVLRGMINAAKSDGRLDDQEREKILGQLGTVEQSEIDFVKQELSEPLDTDAFAKSVPADMGPQVYAMSLTAINLDSNSEAQYLHQLAQGLNMDPTTVNQIHQQLGAPLLYS